MLHEKDHGPILDKNLHCQKDFGAKKLTKEFPAKTWKKIALNFLNWLKETGNCAQEVTGQSGHPTNSAEQHCWVNFHWWEGLRFPCLLTSRMVVFIPNVESSNSTSPLECSHAADVIMEEYFMADAYVRVAMVMA